MLRHYFTDIVYRSHPSLSDSDLPHPAALLPFLPDLLRVHPDGDPPIRTGAGDLSRDPAADPMSPLSPRRLRSGPVSAPQEAFHEHEHKDISGDSPVVPRRLRLPVFFREKPGDAETGAGADPDAGPAGPAAGCRPGGRAGRSGGEGARSAPWQGRSGRPGHPDRDPALHGDLQHPRGCPEILQAEGIQGHPRGSQPADRDGPGAGGLGTPPVDRLCRLEREPARRCPV